MKRLNILFFPNYAMPLLITLILLSGCTGSTGSLCTPTDRRSGSFCYDGINFGQNEDPLFRRGVRDGCETAKGYFRKAYSLSASSASYRRGWEAGRARCRMATPSRP
ncbi:hypothetical protein [Nitratifractor sp.]